RRFVHRASTVPTVVATAPDPTGRSAGDGHPLARTGRPRTVPAVTVRTLIKIAVAVLAAVAAVAVALVALTGVGEESAPATTVPAPRPPAVVETGDPGVGVTVVPSRDELTNLATRPVEAVRVLSPQELLVSV